MKNINLGIGSNYYIKVEVQIDSSKIKKVNDLKQIISSKFKVNGNFTIEKPPSDDLSKIKEDYIFKIKFSNSSKDLNFKLPNKKIIKIEKSDDKEFGDIINSFKNKGIYYSDNCKNDIIFYAWGKKILKSSSKPFYNFPSSSIFDIKLTKEPIILNYENNQYVFSEEEPYTPTSDFILQSLNNSVDDLAPILVNIFRNHYKRYLNLDDKLQKDDVLKSITKYVLVSNDQSNTTICTYVQLDYHAKIFDLRHNVALYCETSDDNIILKVNGKEIEDMNQNMIDVVINNFIYFEIKDQKTTEKETKKPLQEITKSPKGTKKKSKTKKDDKKPPKTVDEPKDDDTKIKKVDDKPPEAVEPKPLKKPAVDKKKFKPKTTPAEKVTTQSNEIKVYFILESSKESFSDTFSPDTTIKEVASKIASSHKIKGKIEIKYADQKGQKISIDQKMTLADISSEMKYETKGSIKNVLFISVKPSQTATVKMKQVIKDSDSYDDDDDDDGDDNSKKMKKVYNVTKRPPKKKSNEFEYLFEFQENLKKLKLKSDTSLKENESEIKKLFKIDKKNQIQYRTSSEDDAGEVIEDENSEMSEFEGKTIKIQILSDKNKVFKPGTVVYKYFYQTNTQMETVFEIELPSKALIKTMKIAIANENKVKSLKYIKVLFAGKDLIDNLVLKDLKIGSSILNVYIRSYEEILLMTAKALIVDVDIEEEEEVKECSSSDFSDDDDD